VLVHGAFVDAAGWDGVKAALEAKGDKVVVVNLPGRPSNPVAAGVKPSLDLYRDAVLAAVNAEPRPVVLVGHSFGGITISNVAEAAPEKVKSLVYVAAFLPQSGQSLNALASTDAQSQLGRSLSIDQRRGLASVARARRSALFCNDCEGEVLQVLPAQMVDEPLAPLGTPVTLTAEKFGRVDKVYVRTAMDLVVSPQLQDRMIAATPVRQMVAVNAGHLPQISKVDELAMILDATARR
jgi:pimeloyl-ACP methyl ester carboxylesterase